MPEKTSIHPAPIRRSTRPPFPSNDKMTVYLVIGVIGLIIALSLVASSIENVRAGHVMVGTKGGYDGEVKETGFSWCVFYGGWEEVRVNTQQMSFVGADEAGDSKGSITVLTQDNLEVYIDLTLVYHLDKKEVGKIIVDYGEDFRDVVIVPNVRSIPRDEATSYTALQLIGSERANFSQTTKMQITDTLANYHIVVESINIRDIRLPTSVMNAVQEKKVAEQKVVTAQYELEAQEFISEKAIVEAKAQQNVTIIEAEAQAQAIDIVITQLASDAGNMTGTDVYLNYLWMQALKDPNSNVKFVISDGATPIILQPEVSET